MPPKTNKQREKLEQSQASSRAKAQDLLRGGGGFVGFANFAKAPATSSTQSAAPANPFTAFASANQTSAYSGAAATYAIDESSGAGGAASAMYDGSDHDIAMALKMLSKKGTVTKIKALNSILTDVIPHKSPPEIRAMVGHFVQLYTFEVRDQKDRKVRQMLNDVLLAMATRLKPKAFIPHLRRLLPYWLMAMHDPNNEAGVAAKKALEALFPDNIEMQAEVIATHLSTIVEEYTTFFQHSPETFPGVTLPESDEREERYERCVAAAVLSLDSILHLFAKTDKIAKLSDDSSAFTVAGILSSDKFGKLVAASSKNANFTRDAIRKATYKTLKSLVAVALPIVHAREEYFAKLILGALNDKFPANQQELWDMVLTFLQAAGPTLWTALHAQSIAKFIKSAVLPRLLAQVRHGFYGSARSSFPVLLPLLSLIPLEHIVDFNSASCVLYSGVVEAAWKFLASSEGRYYEQVVIQSVFECLRAYNDYFLRSGSNREAAQRLFAGSSEPLVDAYVNQFEKSTKDAIVLLVTSPKLSARDVRAFASEWKTMLAKLRGATDEVSRVVALRFAEACENWLAAVLESLPSNTAVDSSRVSVLLQGVDPATDGEAHERLVHSGKKLYTSCLEQLASADTAPRALELMDVLFRVFGAAVVEQNDSYLEHYEAHVQPLVRQAGQQWTESNSTSSDAVLRVARQFYALVDDKKAFVLQLFRDFDVQYGDMKKATALVQACFRSPLTQDGVAQWLASGSFHQPSSSSSSPEEEHALAAVWKAKLLDEFVMISLKGRLDDLDGDAFAALLDACLADLPVLSPDLVVILSHFVAQQSESDVAMRVLPLLVGLFGRLQFDGSHATELGAAQDQLYLAVFHLAAKSTFQVEAKKLWKDHVQTAVVSHWAIDRRRAFIHSLATEINAVFAGPATEFHARVWANYVERYLELASRDGGDEFAAVALVNRLTIFDLRFEGSRSALTRLYDRLLSCLCELEDAHVAVYLEELLDRDATRGVQLLRRLVDIDLCHGLTFAMLQSDSMAPLARDEDDGTAAYISLRPLYTRLARHLPLVLTSIQEQSETRPRYRKVLFLNQQTAELADDDADALDDLSAEDHTRLDRLLSSLLIALLSSSSAAEYGKQWLATPRAFPLPMDRIVHALAANTEEDEASRTVLQEILTKSSDVLAQWPSPAGVQALRVFTSVWSLHSSSHAIAFDAPIHHALLLKVSRSFASASASSLDEWVDACTYLASLPSAWDKHDVAEDTTKRWALAAQGVLAYALTGKVDVAAVARLRVHKRQWQSEDGELINHLTDETALPLARSRRAIADLLRVLATVDSGSALKELPTEQRDALVSTVLLSLAESLTLKTHIVPTYLDLHSSSESLRVIQLAAEVDALLDAATLALPPLISTVNDAGRVKGLLLEAFGSVKAVAATFNREKTMATTPPHTRAVLYTLCTDARVFQSSAADTAGVDINADDEAAAEAALAKSLIPAGLRAALKASFTGSNHSTKQAKRARQQQRHQDEEEGDDVVGRLLVWDLFIQLFPESGGHLGMRSSALCAYVATNGLLSSYLSLCGELLHRETGAQSLVARLTLRDEPLYSLQDLSNNSDHDWSSERTAVALAAQSFFRTVLRLPAMVRTWWNDECSRSLRSWAAKYFEEHITPYVLASELEIIQKASQRHSWDAEEMAVKGSKVSREITTTYVKDECALEMVIRVPPSYPLRSVEVECTRRIGITEDRWRRWVLQIIKVTSAQDGSLLDAVLLWKQNVDKEFDGVEPCPICYSILNPKTMGLPSLACKTCANKYHNSCLYKWFNQSGKNKCPICQQPFT